VIATFKSCQLFSERRFGRLIVGNTLPATFQIAGYVLLGFHAAVIGLLGQLVMTTG